MDTKQLSNEIQLLTLCTKISLSSDDISSIQSLLEQIQNRSDSFIMLAQQHAVIPILYKTLKTYFPEYPICATLKLYYMDIVQVNMSLSAELIKCIHILDTHDIPLLSIKGPVLSKLIYGDITLRQYGDIDILIQKQHQQNVTSLLESHYYIPEITLQRITKKTFFDSVNVLGFETPKNNKLIEIHWELLSKNYAIYWEESLLWERTQTVLIDKHAVRTLNHTNHFVYLCVHGSKHLFERLSWVCDIDHYIQTQNDLLWEEIIVVAKKLGILRMLFLSLNLSQTLLNTPLPPQIKKQIANDKPTQILTQQLISSQFTNHPNNTKNINSFKLLFNMREKHKDKLAFAWQALFATKITDFKFIQLPNYLRFLYPLIRPLRLTLKYFK